MRNIRWRNRCSAGGLLAVVAALAASPVGAQEPPARQERQERMERREMLERRVHDRMEERIRESLGVGAEEFREVREVLHAYRVRRAELASEERLVQMRILGQPRGEAEGGGRAMLPDDEARELLESLAHLRREEVRLFEEEQDALLTLLSPSQVVRLHLVRREMNRRMERLRRGAEHRGGPAGS